MSLLNRLRVWFDRWTGVTECREWLVELENDTDDRLRGAESRIALDLSLLVKQGPKGTLYVRLPAGAGSLKEPFRLGTVWAHVDVLDWVSDDALPGAISGPIVRANKSSLDRLQQFRDAGGHVEDQARRGEAP